MKIKQIIKYISILLTIGSSSVLATPVVLYDHLTGLTDVGGQGIGSTIVSTSFNSSSFCSSGCLLGNITLWMLADPTAFASDFQLALYDHDAGLNVPGSLLTTFTGPSSITQQLDENVFTPDSIVILNNNTDYWVQLSVIDLSFGGQWGRSLSAGQGDYIVDFNIPGFPLTSRGSTSPFMYKVEADTDTSALTNVPIPSAFWLLMTAVLGLTRCRSIKNECGCP